MNFVDTNFSFSYIPPSFLPGNTKTRAEEQAIYDAEKYPESSNTIMCHNEVLDYFQKGRTTIIMWRKERGFPEPISKSPLRWIRSAVMEWVEHEGGFKRAS
ncbi:helix-turn-helix transcriptional regulator [Vibrio diazotrophicus]|uniref:AlpA family transcriptional regulator n=1 Tax=Vibrio diazotrophicus TaxID=685 RepID=A0ABX4WA65_VIBDI|nr:hypothetical protein [Vibrio diazotrophicus]PNH99571.1 hypothetical protein C1O25_16025 [Vibrio diazotrophicus]